MSTETPRVVVTGMGCITPIGNDVPTFWQSCLAGESGAGRITYFDPTAFHVQIACEIKDFDPTLYMDRRDARRMDPFAQIAVASVRQALDQAHLTIDDSNRDDIGVLIGSGIGGLRSMGQGYDDYYHKGPGRVNPLTSALMIANMASGNVAIDLGVRGPNFCVTSACATGNHALGEAFEMIRRGDASVVIAGGSEAALTPLCLAAFHRTGALSTRNDDPKHASRPFDANRDGFVFGEAAAALILERLDFALARNARPLAELVGYGASSDAFHMTAPDENGYGAILSMRRSLKKAGLEPGDIDYVNAHGTSTPLNDKTETLAVKSLLGEHAYEVPISSTKSMTGHLIGAAGAVEAIACVQTLLTGWIHPTINYDVPDPECDLDYVPNRPRQGDVRVVLSNSFGFGGHNASLIFQQYAGQ